MTIILHIQGLRLSRQHHNLVNKQFHEEKQSKRNAYIISLSSSDRTREELEYLYGIFS